MTWVLVAYVALFLLFLFGGQTGQAFLTRWFALTPGSILEGHVWKLATGPLMVVDGLSFFFDALMLWMFVPVLERFWGTKRFLLFVVGSSLVGSAVGVLVGLALGQQGVLVVGLSPFIFASIVAFGVVHANQDVHLFGVMPLKGKILAIGVAVIFGLSTIMRGSWVTGLAGFGGMGYALAVTHGFTPNLWWLRMRRWWLRRRLGVVDGGKKRNDQRWMN